MGYTSKHLKEAVRIKAERDARRKEKREAAEVAKKQQAAANVQEIARSQYTEAPSVPPAIPPVPGDNPNGAPQDAGDAMPAQPLPADPNWQPSPQAQQRREAIRVEDRCPTCDGYGELGQTACAACEGSGWRRG